MRPLLPVVMVIVAVQSSGCAFGPLMLKSSHGRFQESVKQVQDEEFLRNLVRLRYEDSLNILDVASIASQFELGATAEARPFFLTPNPTTKGIFRYFTRVLPDATISGTNRPTFTMIPREDPATVQRYLSPASAESILFFSTTGWPVSNVFRLWLDKINQIPNALAPGGEGSVRGTLPDYERFRRVADVLQAVLDRNAGSFAVETRDTPEGLPTPVAGLSPPAEVDAARNGLRFIEGPTPGTCVLARREQKLVLNLNPQAQGCPEVQELCLLLGLAPDLPEYELSVEELPPYPRTIPHEPLTQIDLVPRSMIKALHYLSNGVAVPPEHLAAGVARTAVGPDGRPFDWRRVTEGLFTVSYSDRHWRPDCAYVAIRYRGYWFYIDDRDTISKSTFNLMLQLSRIDLGYGVGARAGQQGVPVLTLPVGR